MRNHQIISFFWMTSDNIATVLHYLWQVLPKFFLKKNFQSFLGKYSDFFSLQRFYGTVVPQFLCKGAAQVANVKPEESSSDLDPTDDSKRDIEATSSRVSSFLGLLFKNVYLTIFFSLLSSQLCELWVLLLYQI